MNGPNPATQRPSKGPLIAVVVLLATAALAAAWGISSRSRALANVSRETRDLAITTVAVTRPEKGSPQQDLSLPGNIQPYTDAAIFARTTGYLKARHADIGSHVKQGQLLAEIDTPDVDQQLQQARAELNTAEANARLAQTTAERYRDLIKSESVSQQDVDNANGNYEARRAAVQSANANVRRLEQLQGFKKIYAPFEGVITARNTDIGALIGSGTNAKELFHIAETHRLRVYVNVPQAYSRAARPGIVAELELQEFPGKRFQGKLVRTAQSIDPASRTLLSEIDLDNPAGELMTGAYAEVHLKLPTEITAYRLPVNTLIFRAEGVRVGAVTNGRISLIPVTIGRDFGSSVEIVSGLSATDAIVINPPDSLTAGQAVRVLPEPGARGVQP